MNVREIYRRKKKYLPVMAALAVIVGSAVSEAKDHHVVSYDGYDVFDIQYYDSKDSGSWVADVHRLSTDSGYKNQVYDFSEDMKTWVDNVCLQWAEILRPGLATMKQPAQLIVGNNNTRNAYAYYLDWHNGTFTQSVNYLKNILQNGATQPYLNFTSLSEVSKGEVGYGVISIGQCMGLNLGDGNYGWSASTIGQLPQHEITADMSAAFHEMGHVLEIFNHKYIDGSSYYVGNLANDPMSYTSHLLDQNGNHAKANQRIVSSADGYSVDELNNMANDKDKYFLIYNDKAYFKGENLSDVLDGRTFGDIDIDGVPINAVEGGVPELSHIELERNVMSHQFYCSYNTFTEAELAVMQDIGYNIDRRNFYGRSIYNNDLKNVKNTRGFFARNSNWTDYIKGVANTATMGVGLHVYGSRNEITQTSDGRNDGSADILACGVGAAGIRIDGVENTVTLAKDANIEANGTNGVGILVAYGRDHQVNVDGSVSALGEGGDAVRFDFGTNCFGGYNEHRGSYIRYQWYTDSEYYITNPSDMKITDSWSYDLNYDYESAPLTDRINGDLGSKMANLKVSGTLEGKNHAIYMAKNAFVENIDIEDGARIKGDIVSDWKHFGNGLYDGNWGENHSGDKLFLQYEDKNKVDRSHRYDEYCSDLVTKLNINGNFVYDGNITGSDNMKLKVNDGATMVYSGKADVVGVQVAEGANLFGGSYTVNDIAKYASFESVDEEAGKLINHGTIGAASADGNMNINGRLENYGTLLGRSGGTGGQILVSGTADMKSGSKVGISGKGIIGESTDVLQAQGGITGAENIGSRKIGLLDYTANLSADGKSLTATAAAKPSLDGANGQQAADYASINAHAPSYIGVDGADRELREFYALDTDAGALEALDEIAANDKEDAAVAVVSSQASTINQRILSSRLATAMGEAPAMLHIGANNLVDGESAGIDVPVKLPQEQEKSIWVKLGRNSGRTAGGSSYTGNIATIGYDWKHGDNQRNGIFTSYTSGSYGHTDGSENLQDTRIGYYTGISKGPDTALLYGDVGYLKGDRSRLSSIESLRTSSKITGDYTGWLIELGGEWKHALHEAGEKTWQVSPYGAFQMSYMRHNGYRETGSLKAYDVSGGSNFYGAIEGGVEFTRYMPKGSFNFRVGLSQALCGTGYEIHEESPILGRGYTKSSRMDKTHFVSSLAVETEFAPCWQLGAELAFKKGAHDRDILASLQIRRMW